MKCEWDLNFPKRMHIIILSVILVEGKTLLKTQSTFPPTSGTDTRVHITHSQKLAEHNDTAVTQSWVSALIVVRGAHLRRSNTREKLFVYRS